MVDFKSYDNKIEKTLFFLLHFVLDQGLTGPSTTDNKINVSRKLNESAIFKSSVPDIIRNEGSI